MGVYNALVIPDEGVALLASVIATQGTLSVTEMRFSENDYTGQESTLTAATFLGTFVTATPSASVHDSTIINVTGSFTNTGFATSKTLRSIGIIGKDTNNVDTLIAVCTASSPDVIPVPVLSPSTYAYSADIGVSSIDNITVSGSQAGVLFTADIVDNLTSLDTDKPLSAKQGQVLKGLIDNISTAPDEESIVTAGGVLVDYGNKLDEFAEQSTVTNIYEFTNGWHFIDDSNPTLDYSQLPVSAADIGANLSWIRVIKDSVNNSYMAEYTLDGSTGSKWVLPIRYNSAPAPTASDWIKLGDGGINPNLLLNPFFTVNQRGVTSGSADGSTTTVDMWKAYKSSYSISNNEYTFTWDGTGTFGAFMQRVEKGILTAGETYTFSAIIDNELLTQTIVLPNSSDNEWVLKDDIKLYVTTTSASFDQITIRCYDTSAHTVKCAKLELGSTSTLADDIAPEYTTELLKCQRYYAPLAQPSTPNKPDSSTELIMSGNFPVVMRAQPTMETLNLTSALRQVNTNVTPTACNLVGAEKTGAIVKFTGTFTTGKSYNLNRNIWFSAEL